MKVTQLLSVLPLVNSIYTQTDQDCSNNPYQILDDTEFKNLRAELKNNIPSASNDKTLNSRVLSSAKFYKRLPQASWLETNGNSPPMALLSPADQAKQTEDRRRPGDPHEERSISERVMRGWCVVFSNCATPPPPVFWKFLYVNVLSNAGLDGNPTAETKKRQDNILRMLGSVSTAGAITFFQSDPPNAKSMPPTGGERTSQTPPTSNLTINVETKWRGDVLPPGAPKPGNVFATYPYSNVPTSQKNKKSQISSKLSKSQAGQSENDPDRESKLSIDHTELRVRDDLNDDFCFPKDIKDWHLLSKSLWTNVVHPRITQGATSIELDVAHPGVGGPNTIVGGGQVRIRFWLSENPQIDDAKQSSFGDAPDRKTTEPNPIPYLECYDAYIPKGEDVDESGIGELWQGHFLDVCTGPSGFGTASKTIPKYFTYQNVSHAGQGWKGEFFPDINCKAKIACDELAGSVNVARFPDLWELQTKCDQRGPDNTDAFHGGIIYHRVPIVGAPTAQKQNCGYLRISPVSNPGPIPPAPPKSTPAPSPKPYELFSGLPKKLPPNQT